MIIVVGAFSVIVKTGCETDWLFYSTKRRSARDLCILVWEVEILIDASISHYWFLFSRVSRQNCVFSSNENCVQCLFVLIIRSWTVIWVKHISIRKFINNIYKCLNKNCKLHKNDKHWSTGTCCTSLHWGCVDTIHTSQKYMFEI